MVLPARNIVLALGGIVLATVVALALLQSTTRQSICTLSDSITSRPHSVSAKQQRQRKLHLLLPTNAGSADKSPGFCKTVFSALVHGYEPTVINWDVEEDWDVMQRKKVNGVHEYLMNITDENPESDLVFMMDAHDVWCQLSPRTLIERFDELGTSGVVVGAEEICCCWPEGSGTVPETACDGAPPSIIPKGAYAWGEPPRFANSGTVIGSVAAMRTLYKDLVDIFQEPIRQTGSDQGVFNEFLTAGRLSVDYRSRLFWSTAFAAATSVSDFINTPYHIDDLIPHELYPPLLYHSPTGEVPAVIHINGPDKPLIEEWWGKLWWNMLEDGDSRFKDIVLSRVEGRVITFAGSGSKDWRDVCPKDVIGF